MHRFQIQYHRERGGFPKSARKEVSGAVRLLRDQRGAALLEFAVTLPLVVVFVVGIYDFSGAFNQKQKIAQAAQEGAIIVGAQPMSDIQPNPTGPQSLLPVVTAVFNSLVGSGVLPGGPCTPPGTISSPASLTWMYQISNCSTASPTDKLTITINRGCVCGSCGTTCAPGPPYSVGTMVTVQYPYRWRFNSAIQLLIPGASYAAVTQLTESASVHNQM